MSEKNNSTLVLFVKRENCSVGSRGNGFGLYVAMWAGKTAVFPHMLRGMANLKKTADFSLAQVMKKGDITAAL